ncbi:MAG TPA: hypothetical protein VGD65_14150 [Chryseosolibacter sp.]
MKSAIYRTFFFSFLVLACSCETEEPVSTTPGNLNFSWTAKEPSGGRVKNDDEPKSVLISIQDAGGSWVHQLKKLSLYKFGQEYVSESLQLMVGSYQLVQFLVLDENDEIIYATPVEGSEHALLADDPLPIDFEVTESGNTQINPQVLPISPDDDPESFGYATFGFDVIAQPTQGQIKEVWIQEASGGGSYKYLLHYTDNRLSLAEVFARYGNVVEWELLNTITIAYNAEGKMSQKTIEEFTLPPHYTTEKFTTYTYEYGTSGELTHVTRSGGLMSAIDIVYTYDQQGHISSAVQQSSFQTHEFEFTVNTHGDVLTQKRFFVTGLDRKLQYSLEFTYDDSFRHPTLDIIELLTFDIFRHGVSFGSHNIASHRTTIYQQLNGALVETSSCLNTAQYEVNSHNKIASMTYFDPDLCLNKVFDGGSVLTFIY